MPSLWPAACLVCPRHPRHWRTPAPPEAPHVGCGIVRRVTGSIVTGASTPDTGANQRPESVRCCSLPPFVPSAAGLHAGISLDMQATYSVYLYINQSAQDGLEPGLKRPCHQTEHPESGRLTPMPSHAFALTLPLPAFRPRPAISGLARRPGGLMCNTYLKGSTKMRLGVTSQVSASWRVANCRRAQEILDTLLLLRIRWLALPP